MRIRFDRSRFLQTGAVTALLVFTVMAMPLHPAYAQNSDVSARMTRIENEIDTLSRAIFKGETPSPGSMAAPVAGTADLENRLSQIQMDVQALTGKVEEQSYEIQKMKDVERRMAVLEAQLAATQNGTGLTTTVVPGAAHGGGMATVSPGQAPSAYTYSDTAPKESAELDENFTLEGDPNAPAPNTAPTAGQLGTIKTTVDADGQVVAMPATPAGEYEHAFKMLRNRDYAGAQTAFDAFIKAHPDHALVPNAMYWLGETYYVQNRFPEATRVFAEAYQKYPKGSKAPDNLLKLGMALAGQGKTKDACVALAQLKKQYPAGAAPVLTRGDQEIERLKCNAQ